MTPYDVLYRLRATVVHVIACCMKAPNNCMHDAILNLYIYGNQEHIAMKWHSKFNIFSQEYAFENGLHNASFLEIGKVNLFR